MRVLVTILLAAPSVFAQDLAVAVDLPTAKERRAAAAKLAKDHSLEVLETAMRGFAPRGGKRSRTWTETIALGGVETDITIHVPESYRPDKPAGAIFSLHGAGGDGTQEPARWRQVAEELGYLVIAPTDAGENAGYRFSQEERTAALAALRWARRTYNVDENRIHLTGVSRGGHMTWDLGTRRPDLFASLAPIIGGPRLDPSRGQNNLRFLENIAHLPIRDLQGEQDDKRMLFNLRLAFHKLKKLGATDAQFLTFPELGHSFRFEAVPWKDFYARARRDPQPARVVRLSANAREGRAHWVEILKTKRPVAEKFVPQVRANEWAAMDDGAKRRFLADSADKRTARLAVEMVQPGVFVATSSGVGSFRLLLTADMFDSGEAVKVTWNGRVRTRKLKPSGRVLALDFVERFDRTFLPVAEFKVP